jgi:hypothetical protein
MGWAAFFFFFFFFFYTNGFYQVQPFSSSSVVLLRKGVGTRSIARGKGSIMEKCGGEYAEISSTKAKIVYCEDFL